MAQPQAAEPSPSPWSSLPPEATAAVLRRLASHADRVRFAAVCRPWRSAARKQPPPPLPWLALPEGTFFSFPSPAALRFPAAARYHGSCDDWLLFRHRDEGRYTLLNPFSGATMRLPRLSSFRYVVHDSRKSGGMTRPPPVDIHDGLVLRKVIVLPGRQAVAALVADERQRSKVAVWLPVGTDEDDDDDRWLLSAHDPWRGLRDLAFYDGKLHAVDAYGDLYARAAVVDETNGGEAYYDGDPMVCAANRVVAAPAKRCAAPSARYLVASGGRLLMVHRVLRGDDASELFEVFAAYMAASRWAEVARVGRDTALFVGQWSSVSRRVSRHGMPGNTIHFLDDDVVDSKGERRRRGGFGSYDMVDGSKTVVPLLAELRNGANDTPMTWLFPRDPEVATRWHDLSTDVFRHVFHLLPSGDDRAHLSQVCRDLHAVVRPDWRPHAAATNKQNHVAAVSKDDDALETNRRPFSATAAYLAVPNGTLFDYPDYHAKSRRLADAAADFRGAAADGGWLLFYEDDEGLGLLRLFSPFTGRTMLLPSLLGIRTCHEPIEMDASLSRGSEQWWDESETMAVQKLVVCPDDGNGVVVAALVGRDNRSKLALCSLESFSWQFSARDRWRRYEDLLFFRGRLYALTSGEDLIAFDYAVDRSGAGEPPRVTRVERVISGVHAIPHDTVDVVTVHYLVASARAGGDEGLLMVRRVFPPARREQQRFAVFRARLAEWPAARWVEQRDLGGETLFVGRRCSRAVAPGPPPPGGVRGDEIFFLGDDCLGMAIWADRGCRRPLPSEYHTSVYDMRTGAVTNLQLRDLSREGPAPPTWIFFPDDNADQE